MNKRKTGTEKETLAGVFLEKNGVKIIERNFHTRYGEIDLIGLHEGYLVFFEVKYRKNAGCGYPQEAVTPLKQRKISRMAQWYLYMHADVMERIGGIRYDVVAILDTHIGWIRNAFDHRGR